MESKLNLFDVIGYLVPGCVLAVLLLLMAVRLDVTAAEFSAGAAIVLLPVGYVVGFVSYHGVSLLLKSLAKVFNRPTQLESQKLLTDDADDFTSGFRAELKEELKIRFGVEADTPEDVQQAFDLCYDFVIQRGIGAYTENFRAVDGLCKNLIGLGVIGAWAVVLCRVCDNAWTAAHWIGICASLVTFAVGVHGHSRFSRRFAVSVYRSFYVWSKTQK